MGQVTVEWDGGWKLENYSVHGTKEDQSTTEEPQTDWGKPKNAAHRPHIHSHVAGVARGTSSTALHLGLHSGLTIVILLICMALASSISNTTLSCLACITSLIRSNFLFYFKEEDIEALRGP